MKRLLLVLVILLMAASVYAAGSCVVSSDSVNRVEGAPTSRLIALTCTSDAADATIADFTLNADTAGVRSALKGWDLYKVATVGNHAGVEPSDDMDFAVYQKVGTVTKAIDLMDNNGVNKIDPDANFQVYPAIDGEPARQPIVNDITVVPDLAVENSETLSITYFDLILKPTK